MTNKNNKDKTIINIIGMHCASCVSRIEKALNAIDGVESATVNLITEKAFVVGNAPIAVLYKTVEGLGFGVVKDKPTKAEPLLKRSQSYGDEKTRFLWSAIFTFPIFLLSMVPVQF
ncbi:MAG: cation transporter, partial [Candidatus Anammoxibacter sp.]